jgi:hypothetical protein
LPLCATSIIEKEQRERVPPAIAAIRENIRRMPELIGSIHPTGWTRVVAKMIQIYNLASEKEFLEGGIKVGFVKGSQKKN